MNSDLLMTYIQAQSLTAQMEAMKAKNQMRLARNENPEYDYEDFNMIALQLDKLVEQASNCVQ